MAAAELLASIAALTARLQKDDAERTRAVRAARDAGATWPQIADALGVTTQAAQQRYGRRWRAREEPDGR